VDWITTLASRLSDLRDPLEGFALELVLTLLIYLHYRRFGGALTGKQSFAPVLPFVGLTTFLVITTVKSSFALSLGLVGALSIVRFRTPVKDPEELAYIFLTISSGIGVAAGQRELTAVVVVLILMVLTFTRRSIRAPSDHVYVSLDLAGVTDAEAAFAAVGAALQAHSRRVHVTRVEHHGDVLHVTAEAELPEPNAVPRIAAEVRRHYPATNVSAHDESRLPAP
jgi:hypothetical protein